VLVRFDGAVVISKVVARRVKGACERCNAAPNEVLGGMRGRADSNVRLSAVDVDQGVEGQKLHFDRRVLPDQGGYVPVDECGEENADPAPRAADPGRGHSDLIARRTRGKVAVITGASSGIGLSTARKLHAAGAEVVLFSRDGARLAEAGRALGRGALTVEGDVTRQDDLERLYSTVRARHGGIDVLFVNAGIAEWVLAAEVTEDHFDCVFGVNARGAFFTIQRALPLLREGSAVVLNTSAADRVGAPRTSVYSASKAALRSFARTLSAEFVVRGIRANAVSPGPTETPIHEKSARGLRPEVLAQRGKATMSRVPMGRPQSPKRSRMPCSSWHRPRPRSSSAKSSPSTAG
jgi:NAD(P)-dependent dehydrogenase (short-subunit alcohol dehydrogenase family)